MILNRKQKPLDTLKFIFYIGIAFSIFQMLWWLLNGLISYLRGTGEKTIVQAYLLKSIHYLLLMPVLVSFISLKGSEGKIASQSYWYYFSILIGVTIAYLFGKIQRRQKMNKLRSSLNMVFKNSIPPFSFKWELIVSIVAIAFLVLNLLVPVIHESAFILWISETIASIYNMFFIGLIFRIVGIIFVISLFWKLISGIRSLFGYDPDEHSHFDMHVHTPDDNQGTKIGDSSSDDDDFVDYEEVD